MHSNTGQYGSNKNVSAINEELIKKYFVIILIGKDFL